MRAPQIIYIVILAMGFAIAMMQHGKPKEGKNSIWPSLVSTVIQIGLLIWGGFFG